MMIHMMIMTFRELLEALPRTQQDAWRENFQGRVEEVIVIVIVIFVIIVLIVIIVIIVITSTIMFFSSTKAS